MAQNSLLDLVFAHFFRAARSIMLLQCRRYCRSLSGSLHLHHFQYFSPALPHLVLPLLMSLLAIHLFQIRQRTTLYQLQPILNVADHLPAILSGFQRPMLNDIHVQRYVNTAYSVIIRRTLKVCLIILQL